MGGSTAGSTVSGRAIDVERYLAERAARITLQLDRIERSYLARVSVNINNAAADAAAGISRSEAEEVLTLGRRLFWDARGPLALYPHSPMMSSSKDAARLLFGRRRRPKQS